MASVILIAGLAAFYFETKSRSKNPTDTIRVACVGDSITEGTEYPADLWMMLGTNYTVGNFGVGGATVSLQSEASYLNRTELQNAKKFMPNYVIIMLGTNDAFPSRKNYLGSLAGDYEKIVYEFQAISTKPKIFVVLPPPIFNNSLGPDSTILMEDVVPRIKEVASKLGLPTIDVYTPLVDHSTYFWDGVHPNSEGAKIIATQIYNAID